MMGTPQTINRQLLRLQAGGTLQPEKHIYITRAEDELLVSWLRSGEFVSVLSPRQMGKSSLMIRAIQKLHEEGTSWVLIDLAAELGTIERPEDYFCEILRLIAASLELAIDVPSWWRDNPSRSNSGRFLEFIRSVVCPRLQSPLVIFLDEIDSTIRHQYTDDLFTAIRGIYNQRRIFAQFDNVTFCLLGVATPNELIKDRRTTPFNVGNTLELSDFDETRDDLRPLAAALSDDADTGRRLLGRVLYWTGGHPYLTQKFCIDVRKLGAPFEDDIDRYVDESFGNLSSVADDVHFQQILRFVDQRLSDSEAAFNLYDHILAGHSERDEYSVVHAELKLSGLVKRGPDGFLIVRNRIYERVFDKRWVQTTRPRRLVARYQKIAVLAATLAFASIAVMIAGFFYWSSQVRPSAEKARIFQALAEKLVSVSASSKSGAERLEVTFPKQADQNLFEQVVPLISNLPNVVSINLGGTDVTDIGRISRFTDLQTLDLHSTSVSDLGPASRLASLRTLNASNTRVTSLAALTKLRQLENLDVSDSPVEDLSPLSSIQSLRSINLSGIPINSIEPLRGLGGLEKVNLSGTSVRDVGALSNLKDLRALNLGGTSISAITSLSGLAHLENLNLSGAGIASLNGIEGLTALNVLNLGNINATNLAPLSGLRNLSYLVISGVDIEDISPLRDLTTIRTLYLNGTKVVDVAPLAGLTKLSILSLAGSKRVSNIGALRDLADLSHLDLGNTNVADISPIASMMGLEELDLTGSPIVDLTPLGGLTGLQNLYLGETKVSDLSAISELRNLQILRLPHTFINNVEALRELTALVELNLANTPISDVRPLSNLTNLKNLDLSNTKVADIYPLASLSQLTVLNLARTSVDQISALRTLAQLENLNLNYTKVSNVASIVGLPNLRTLDLIETSVPPAQEAMFSRQVEIVRIQGCSLSGRNGLPQCSGNACSKLGDVKSTSGPAATITFNNNSSQRLKIFWLGYDGQQMYYGSVDSGRRYVQNTFQTHPWLLTTQEGKCVGVYLPTQSQVVVYD
jgi:Leucine-rich repeat (LRR) protein